MNRPRLARRLAAVLLFAALPTAAAVSLTGCGNSQPALSLNDMTDFTADTLSELLLGPPVEPTAVAPRDPPLLIKGEKEIVQVSADTAAFAAVSRGSIPEDSLKQARKDVVKLVNRRIGRRGFKAEEATTFPPPAPEDPKRTLVVTLTPDTQAAGSPQDRARGKKGNLVLVRLRVTDPATGDVLRDREFYSGRDVRLDSTPTLTPF